MHYFTISVLLVFIDLGMRATYCLVMKILFLHGLGQGPGAWDAVLGAMDGVDTVVPSLYEAVPRPLEYICIKEKLERIVCSYEEPVAIVGLSLGAVLALDIASTHPDKVAALCLIAPQARMPRRLMAFQDFIFRFMPSSAFRGMGLEKDDVLSLTRSMRKIDLDPGLGAITCPCLILCGSEDKANKAEARRITSKLPDARFELVEGAGHEVNKDSAQMLARKLSGLLLLNGHGDKQ